MKSSVRLLAVGILALLGVVTPALAQTAAPVGVWDGVVSVSNGTIDRYASLRKHRTINYFKSGISNKLRRFFRMAQQESVACLPRQDSVV